MKLITGLGALLWVGVFLGAVVVGCVTDKAKDNEEQALEDMTPEEQQAYFDYKAEIEIGRKMASRLLGFYGTYPDKELAEYINRVGLLVASYSDFPERRYMFAIMDTEEVNAFASPGGYILVSLGAIRLAENEAQLAMVLGHEVAHVGKKHMMDTLKRMEEEEEKKKKKEEITDPPPLAVLMRHRVDPKAQEEEGSTSAALAKYLGGGAAATINVVKAASAGMSTLLEKGIDHSLEYEADEEGTKYAIRAGYKPDAAVIFLNNLKKKISKKNSVFTKTHPSVKTRITKVENVLKEIGDDEIVGATGKKRFAKFHKRLKAPSKG